MIPASLQTALSQTQNPRERARLWMGYANLMQEHDHTAVLFGYQQAATELRQVRLPTIRDAWRLATIENNHAVQLILIGKWELALPLSNHVVEVYRMLQNKGFKRAMTKLLAQSLENQGNILRNLERYNEAQQALEEALKLNQNYKVPAQEISTLMALAGLKHQQKDLVGAWQATNSAILLASDLVERNGQAAHTLLAAALQNAVELLYAWGRTEDAKFFARKKEALLR